MRSRLKGRFVSPEPSKASAVVNDVAAGMIARLKDPITIEELAAIMRVGRDWVARRVVNDPRVVKPAKNWLIPSPVGRELILAHCVKCDRPARRKPALAKKPQERVLSFREWRHVGDG